MTDYLNSDDMSEELRERFNKMDERELLIEICLRLGELSHALEVVNNNIIDVENVVRNNNE